MNIRRAVYQDIEDLIRLRLALFAEINGVEPSVVGAELVEATRRYLISGIGNGSFVAWIVEDEGEIIGTSGLVFFYRPPYPGNLMGREAYILNMYTVPHRRRQGIATALVKTIMAFAERECLKRVWLHASSSGRPLYEKAGFAPNSSEMEWIQG